MVLYYAMGGGLGHLTRADAFLRMLNISDFRIITASTYSNKIFQPDDLILISNEFENYPKLLTDHLQDILNKTRADSVFIDTFSHGILGELNDINWGNSEVNYITRRVKWNNYSPKVISKIRFYNTYILESLEPAHQRLIERDSDIIIRMQIQYPQHVIDPECELVKSSREEKWVIIHSGPKDEVWELINRAKIEAIEESKNPALFLISQVEDISGESLIRLNTYHAHGYLGFANRIFSACGFNIMKQTANYRKKHRFYPFKRRYDDQFWRAKEARI